MLKDIPQLKVENVAVAIVKEQSNGADVWNAYIINLKNEVLQGVLITSKGYGIMEGEERKTSTLRHFIENIPPQSWVKIEPITDNVLNLNNEYWVSFYLNNTMYDRKYVFLPGVINEEFFTQIPLLEKRGVMIR
ncbi:MAG: hypothetical protein JST71_08475 [Bacteroidetes bacterium]|nr:hypothetical protein [Bacteroidota bacterium]MBX7239655.1 hypothetical protein [Bacteroidia bacterium]MCC7515142.1 hypothetical protein [Bacteroidia bacterium]MCW5918599.1 hypothetical protein [Bacteroidota bacterium]HCI57488.1 hypothetical protein [Bacteroidota bacterium]